MIISFFNLKKYEQEIIEDELKVHELRFFDDSANCVKLEEYQESEIICICANSRLNASILEQCHNLKYIVTHSTGIDHIDTKYCQEHNIKVKNAIEYGGITVSEYQFGLLLELTRKISKAQEQVKNGEFAKQGLQGIDLNGKTIGIIGYGHIGKNVVKIAQGFGMKVLINTKEEISEFNKVTLDEIYMNSDIISINIPANNETYHLVNKEAFEKMKQGVIIINTARGSIIDTDALIDALENKKVSAAGLDVLEEEKILNGEIVDINESEKEIVKNRFNKLLNFENVIITPHNAYNSKESEERIFKETLENVKNSIENK